MTSPPEVPARFSRFGVVRPGAKPPFEKLRCLLMGHPKSGKTSVACSCPTGLVLDFEQAARLCPTGAASIIEISSVDTLHGVLRELEADKARTYTTVFIDTLDAFADLLARWITDRWKARRLKRELTPDEREEIELATISDVPQGRGWGLQRDLLCDTLQRLVAAGYGWWGLVHVGESVVRVGDEEQLREFLLLAPKLRGKVTFMTEMAFGTLRTTRQVTEKKQVGNRVVPVRRQKEVYFITAGGSPSLGQGCRIPMQLPVEINDPAQAWALLRSAYRDERKEKTNERE